MKTLGVIVEERMVYNSVPRFEGKVSFQCDSSDGSLKTSLVTM